MDSHFFEKYKSITGVKPRYKWYFIPNYPRVFSYERVGGGYSLVLIGIGGNLGSCGAVLHRFWQFLRKMPSLGIPIATSPILKNPAFGTLERMPDYFNAVVLLKTRLGLSDFRGRMFYWERFFGRKRKRLYKNQARTFDLDILDFRLNAKYAKIPKRYFGLRQIPLFLPSFLRLSKKKEDYPLVCGLREPRLPLEHIHARHSRYHWELNIPHIYWEERDSVVLPLMFLKNYFRGCL